MLMRTRDQLLVRRDDLLRGNRLVGPRLAVADVIDPFQQDYNISPQNLQALYNATLKQTGLPPSEVLPDLPAPT